MSVEAALSLETAFAAVPRADEDDLLISVQGAPRLQFEYLRLLYPALVEYRGGLFVDVMFDQAAVDDILQHSDEADPLAAAQRLVNSIDLASTSGDEPFDGDLARAIGNAVAFAWTHWIRDRFGREIVTVIDIGPYEGVAWFRAAPQGEFSETGA